MCDEGVVCYAADKEGVEVERVDGLRRFSYLEKRRLEGAKRERDINTLGTV
jgi:hypothetical protein